MNYNYSPIWAYTPGYIILDIPPEVKSEIQSTLGEFKEEKEQRYDKVLAGHLEKEFSFPITPNLKGLVEQLSYDYCAQFHGNGKLKGSTLLWKKPIKFSLEDLWINFAKKHDFNPPHTHEGVFSFVIWVKVPYTLEKEDQKFGTDSKMTARFFFQRPGPSGDIQTETLPVDKHWEWKMVFFDANQTHGVFPFYSSEEYRVSIAGNIFIS